MCSQIDSFSSQPGGKARARPISSGWLSSEALILYMLSFWSNRALAFTNSYNLRAASISGSDFEGAHRSFEEQRQHLRGQARGADEGTALRIAFRQAFIRIHLISEIGRGQSLVQLLRARDPVLNLCPRTCQGCLQFVQ